MGPCRDDQLMPANATAEPRLRLICRRTRPAKVVNWEKQEMGTESYGQTSFLLSRYRQLGEITIRV